MPVVFVAFGAEERRRQSTSRSQYALGSRAYIDAMSKARRHGLRGMINIDMVGARSNVQIIGPSGPMVGALYASARKMKIPAETHATISQGFSDHVTFQAAGYPVGWLWAGDNPTLHTPRDRMGVIQRAEIARIGRVAWATLQTLRI
jgi:Zn-dependent M28 family amino/carboxypeptidase